METETANEKEMNLLQILGDAIYGIFILLFRLILLILVLSFLASLFFHFVFTNVERDDVFHAPIIETIPNINVFPKENISLSKTFVFRDDISNLIKKYNNADFIQKILISQDPLYRKLVEKGFVERGLIEENWLLFFK